MASTGTERKKSEEKLERLAIVNPDRCRPRRCALECKKCCPVNRRGQLCIEVEPTQKLATISEELCIGCGLCPKKCPFQAITIINLPKDLEKFTTHRYGPNSFKLHRMPVPRPGEILGLVGSNGTGKSTALRILAGKLKPNLGKFTNPPEWVDILKYFRGSELQGFFQKIVEDKLKAVIKPQYVDVVPKTMTGKVGDNLKKSDEVNQMKYYVDELDLAPILDRDVSALSGGELQRFTIALACLRKAEVFMIDEPSSYLDVKQRLKAAQVIRALRKENNFIIVVEHDLSVLDYLSDYVVLLYGLPGAYGVCTLPYGVREGINNFLAGFIPTENLRFREDALNFKIVDADAEEIAARVYQHNYPKLTKTMGDQFKLTVMPGEFTNSEIIVLLGQNGTGKTTFIRLLAGIIKPDDEKLTLPALHVSFKPQTISPKFKGSVKDLLCSKILDAYNHAQFQSDVLKPLQISELQDQQLQNLSGGELQRVAICLALGKPADLYLLDEPSAFLDSEQRLAASKVIKRFILHAKKTAFVVEHDFIMATYLADRVIVYDGTPSVCATANSPVSLLKGMNEFLKALEITFRKDEESNRPRINKQASVKDREQKAAGEYFYMDLSEPTDVKGKKPQPAEEGEDAPAPKKPHPKAEKKDGKDGKDGKDKKEQGKKEQGKKEQGGKGKNRE